MQFCSKETKWYRWDVYPEKIDTRNPNFLLFNNKVAASLIIINYNKEMEGAFLGKVLSLKANLQISIFYERQDTTQIISKLTYGIGNVGSEMKTTNENQIDSNIVEATYNDAKYIKSKMQIDGDDLYYLYVFMIVYASTEEELKRDIEKVEGVLGGNGITVRKGTYRQVEVLKACMPFSNASNNLKRISKRNVLSSGIVATYPFVTNELLDNNGILIGMNSENASPVMINRFESGKYKNANMCVIGTSGSRQIVFYKANGC